MIMVKAGGRTDAVIDAGAAAGVGRHRHRRRQRALPGHDPPRTIEGLGLHFVGAGVSGGEEGALNGPSMMPGGSAESYESLGPLLERISAKVDGDPLLHLRRTGRRRPLCGGWCNGHRGHADRRGVRPDQAGHRGRSAAEIAKIFRSWNQGDLESFLIEITAEVSRPGADGQPLVDVVLDQADRAPAAGRCRTRWIGVPITGIAEATLAGRCPGGCRSARRGRPCCRGHRRVDRRRRGRLRRGRRQGAVCVEGRRLLPGFRSDRRSERRVRLGHRPRWPIWRGGCIIRAVEPDHRGVLKRDPRSRVADR